MKKCIAMALSLLLGGAAAAQDFPVTVQHSQGKVTLKQPPERVVALSLADYDTLVSLGVQPVNYVVHMPQLGTKPLPWNKPTAGKLPMITPSKVSLEYVAALRPDLIDASNMYNVDRIYSQLSNIAPTLIEVKGNSNGKWSSDSWQERTLYTGRLVGKEAKAKKVVNNTEKTIQQFIKRHPELKGKTFTFSSYMSGFGLGAITGTSHPTTRFLGNLGIKLSPAMKTIPSSEGQQAVLSEEAWNHLNADYVFVGYTSKEDQKALESNPFFKNIINKKGVKYIPLNYNETFALQVPDPLNIPWLLKSLEAKL